MPKSEKKNEHLREAQRLNILDGARKVFALKGWSATMAEVAIESGVSQGLAYRYFSSKEAIFNELISQSVQSGLASLQYIEKMHGTPGERLNFWISKILDTKRESIGSYQLSFLTPNDNATSDNKCEPLYKQGKAYFDIIRELIIQGQDTGEVAKGDPDQMTIAITSCIDGLSRFALRTPELLKKHFPDTAIILRMIKP